MDPQGSVEPQLRNTKEFINRKRERKREMERDEGTGTVLECARR
jgi:hypothetical protein